MGFVFSGSGDIPNGRFALTPAQLACRRRRSSPLPDSPALGANGFTFNDAGARQPAAGQPAGGRFQPDAVQLSAGAAGTLDAQRIHALRLRATRRPVTWNSTSATTGSISSSRSRTSTATFLFNTNNPVSRSPTCRRCWRSSMRAETGSADAAAGPDRVHDDSERRPGDPQRAGRRLVELPFRHNVDDHNVWRAALGMKGDLGDASDKFLRNLSYDVYYSFARSEDSSRQEGAASRSRYAAGVAVASAARTRWRTSSARTSPKRP